MKLKMPQRFLIHFAQKSHPLLHLTIDKPKKAKLWLKVPLQVNIKSEFFESFVKN